MVSPSKMRYPQSDPTQAALHQLGDHSISNSKPKSPVESIEDKMKTADGILDPKQGGKQEVDEERDIEMGAGKDGLTHTADGLEAFSGFPAGIALLLIPLLI